MRNTRNKRWSKVQMPLFACEYTRMRIIIMLLLCLPHIKFMHKGICISKMSVGNKIWISPKWCVNRGVRVSEMKCEFALCDWCTNGPTCGCHFVMLKSSPAHHSLAAAQSRAYAERNLFVFVGWKMLTCQWVVISGWARKRALTGWERVRQARKVNLPQMKGKPKKIIKKLKCERIIIRKCRQALN